MIRQTKFGITQIGSDMDFLHKELLRLERRTKRHVEQGEDLLCEAVELLEVGGKIPCKDAARGKEAPA